MPNPVDLALAAAGTPFYGRLAQSQVVYAAGAPNAGQPVVEVGTPGVDELSATDQGGSVGVNPVTLNVGADAISFMWDVSRWAKGDVFVGLNYAAYKVLDRHGDFKRYLASSDYGRLDQFAGEVGEATTGCAANWRTGEIFMTNFDDIEPALNVITRQPGSGVDYPFPYANQARRVSTAIFRSEDPTDGTWVYPIDTSPESIVFDGTENLYVGHSGPYFDTVDYSILDPNLKKVFDSATSYTFVDELGAEVLARPMGTSGAGTPITYFPPTHSRLDTTATGEVQFNPPTPFTWGAGLDESATLTLAKTVWENADLDLALENVLDAGVALAARPILGKRLHKYNYTGAPAAPYSGASRELHWTFTNRQGTDWLDLAADQTTMFYTSEDSYIHRYDTATGLQMADFGTGRRRQLGGAGRVFHALRILPPGDGTGGVIVAAGTEILRLNTDGQVIQRYQVVGDPDVAAHDIDGDTRGLVKFWYSLEVDPSGRTFWASGHDTGYLYQFDLATGAQLKGVKAVDFIPLNDPVAPFGRRVEGICIMWEYTAAQETCGDGVDNDGDGFVDESCTPIESCSLASPGDDDGDGLDDHNDPDCGVERPPTALA
ncbi:MAG: hypothetical protein NUW22_10270, partial [Acidobacteria bacterium]|nr:hypothetical protein [Acidobacteriota bacterium]